MDFPPLVGRREKRGETHDQGRGIPILGDPQTKREKYIFRSRKERVLCEGGEGRRFAKREKEKRGTIHQILDTSLLKRDKKVFGVKKKRYF